MFLARHAERRQKGKPDGSLNVFNRRPDAVSRRSLLRTECASLAEARGWLAKGGAAPEPYCATQSRALAIVRRM